MLQCMVASKRRWLLHDPLAERHRLADVDPVVVDRRPASRRSASARGRGGRHHARSGPATWRIASWAARRSMVSTAVLPRASSSYGRQRARLAGRRKEVCSRMLIWGEVVEYWAPVAAGRRRRCGSRTATSRGPTWTGAPTSWPPAWRAWASATATGSGILLHNRPEFVETAMACMKLGAIGVPINVRFTATRAGLRVRQRRLPRGRHRGGAGGRAVAHGRASARACRSSTPTTARSTRRATPGGDRPRCRASTRPTRCSSATRAARPATRRVRCSPTAAGTTRRCAGRCRAASTSTTACCCRSRWPSPAAWPC